MIHIQGNITLHSGGHSYRLKDQENENRLVAPSVGSILYLLRFRHLLSQVPVHLPVDIMLCLRDRPLVTLSLCENKFTYRPHPLRFVKRH